MKPNNSLPDVICGGLAVKVSVLKIELFRRKGSRFYQARITSDAIKKRISTRTINPTAAEEFAVLAYRHFSRLQKKGES